MMRKDPTEWRKKFDAWKNGTPTSELFNLPKYDGGTDDKTYLPEYEYEATVTPQGTSLEKHKRITNEEDWLKYWGNVGAGYVSLALEAAAPVVLNGMSMLMGNPVGALAGIAGEIFGEDAGYRLGANISPEVAKIGSAVGGLAGGVVFDPENIRSFIDNTKGIVKLIKPLIKDYTFEIPALSRAIKNAEFYIHGFPFARNADDSALRIIQENYFDNATRFAGPMRYKRFGNYSTVGDIVPDAYYARSFGGKEKSLSQLTSEEEWRLLRYIKSINDDIPFRDTKGSRFIHMDDSGPQPVSTKGLLPKDATNSNSPWNSSINGEPEIWWNKNRAYYPYQQYLQFLDLPRTYVTTEQDILNRGLGSRGFEHGLNTVRTTKGVFPFEAIDYAIEPNEFGFFNLLKFYDKGKSIHIKPTNRGKFNATKKRTGKTTEQLAHSKNPLTRKRAVFALNSRKFKH